MRKFKILPLFFGVEKHNKPTNALSLSACLGKAAAGVSAAAGSIAFPCHSVTRVCICARARILAYTSVNSSN